MAQFVRVNDYEEHAKTFLSKAFFEFVLEGSGHQETVTNNKEAYKRFKIRPRYFQNVKNRTMTRNILGKPVSIPIGISPTGLQKLAHEDGECATARAAQEVDTIFILSSYSTSSIQEVAEAAPKGRKWFQTFLFNSREVNQDLAAKAEKTGFEAIVITVDFPVMGLRYSYTKHQLQLPKHLTLSVVNKYFESGILSSMDDLANPSANWADITWLKSITKLPIIAKGILTAEDAIKAVDAGVSAILVSNHGGRQLDGLPSTIESLSEIVQAVGDKVEIYLDGGIRDGTDAFKALALGVKMAFVGRPAIWGLAHSGEEGVRSVLNILQNELDKVMAISGCSHLDEITRDRIVHESYFSKI